MTIEFGALWIGVSIIVAGGVLYALSDKMVKALEKQKQSYLFTSWNFSEVKKGEGAITFI